MKINFLVQRKNKTIHSSETVQILITIIEIQCPINRANLLNVLSGKGSIYIWGNTSSAFVFVTVSCLVTLWYFCKVVWELLYHRWLLLCTSEQISHLNNIFQHRKIYWKLLSRCRYFGLPHMSYKEYPISNDFQGYH